MVQKKLGFVVFFYLHFRMFASFRIIIIIIKLQTFLVNFFVYNLKSSSSFCLIIIIVGITFSFTF